MDRILESYLDDFIQEFGYTRLEKSRAFELFVNYVILSKIHTDVFDIESTSAGGGNDTAIDGLAVIVNEHIVTTTQEVDYFRKSLRRLDVKFIFVQSKMGTKFESEPIGNFLFGVKSFFGASSPIDVNAQIQNLRDLKEYVYNRSIDMDNSPVCEMYYVTTGVWNNDKNLQGRVEAESAALRQTKLFSEVNYNWVDGEVLKQAYRELRNKIVGRINFEKHTSISNINGVHQAYIGVLPASEYLSLIVDKDGNLQRNLFYDNVRDYQGNNIVNQEIAATINDPSHNDLFALLNNGVTVVAKSITQVGTTFTIRDYQIVNGCQTSHVLYQNRTAITDKVFLPVKLIVTDDPDVSNQIIKATNSQTAVHSEAFVSLLPFQKELEEFYRAVGGEKQLFYERRSKQYDGHPIAPAQIISIALQAYSFLAMFLNDPHSTHRYYGELLKANEDKIFLEDHSPYPYYVSGYALHSVQNFFQNSQIDPELKIFRYHLLMLFRMLAEKMDLPALNSRNTEKYCSELRDILWNEEAANSIFQQAIEILQLGLKNSSLDPREAVRRKSFTEDLISLAIPGKQSRFTTAKREMGTVKWFSEIKGYGFIIPKSQGKDVFFHANDINLGTSLAAGDAVSFIVITTELGPNAKDIQRNS